jgi:hypothetical protein
MPSVSHQKKKQRIALAVRIEKAGRAAQPCSFCRSQSRKCFLNLQEGARCSECVRSKRACDTTGYLPERPPLKQVCRFFFRPRPKRIPTPPPEPLPVVDDDWLPWLPDPSMDLDPSDPLWSEMGFGDVVPWGSPGFLTGTVEAASGSSDFP